MAMPRGDYHGLFIEMKSKGGRLSDYQKKWLLNLNNNGYLALPCYSVDEAMDTASRYLGRNLINV